MQYIEMHLFYFFLGVFIVNINELTILTSMQYIEIANINILTILTSMQYIEIANKVFY